MIREVTNTKTLVSYSVGDMVEYRPFSWFPVRQLLVSKAVFHHEQSSAGAYWALEMVDTKTGEVIKEQGQRVKKLMSAA
jgi:hypothetical protein